MSKLLNIDANPKTVKGQKRGYMTAVLYLAPWKAAGVNLCPMAEIAGCHEGCLNVAGRGGIARNTFAPYGVDVPDNTIQRARIRKTRWFVEHQSEFMAQLRKEIYAFIRKANKADLTACVRLNGTSDIRWENYDIIETFPSIQFYDYTKLTNRRNLPDNYHLTLSYSEANQKYAMQVESSPLNIAAVFRDALPATFLGRDVVNGDESDLRFLDPSSVVVGLKAKGKAKKDQSGFVIDVV